MFALIAHDPQTSAKSGLAVSDLDMRKELRM